MIYLHFYLVNQLFGRPKVRFMLIIKKHISIYFTIHVVEHINLRFLIFEGWMLS